MEIFAAAFRQTRPPFSYVHTDRNKSVYMSVYGRDIFVYTRDFIKRPLATAERVVIEKRTLSLKKDEGFLSK